MTLCFFACTAAAKGQVQVYADIADDSVKHAVAVLFKELEKAGFGRYTSLPVAGFKGKGVLLLKSDEALKNKIKLPDALKKSGSEGVYIKGDTKSLIVAGNSALAIQQAVFIYLEQLGFRYLLPGELWEVIPRLTSIYKPVSLLTQPAFDLRSIANAHGFGGRAKMEEEFNFWAKANRLGGSLIGRVGHAYEEIVLRNMDAFKQHPEYFAQPVSKGTIPDIPKFNVANKELVKLVVDDAFKTVELYKKLGWNTSMISMEPSDGGGMCTTPECKAIGGPSEQFFYLSNTVAKALQKKYPGTLVGHLAYNEHILPPKFSLEPNIFVMVTNGFNRSKYSTEELLQLWGKKTPRTGVYDYLSVYEWDHDLPGQVPSARAKEMAANLKTFYKNGSRAFLGESVMGWINRGPGQYVLSRLLWDINADVQNIRNDFFDKGFGKAAPMIKKLYDEWEVYPHRIAMDNDLADWLAWVNEAYGKAETEAIKKRIDQIKCYLHYVVLYRQLKKNPSEANMLNVLSYAYRNFEKAPFATLPTLVSLPAYSGYNQMGWYAAPDQKWKASKEPYSAAEIQAFFSQDIRDIKRGPDVSRFQQADQFLNLSAVTKIPERKFYQSAHTLWGKTEYIININKKGDQNYFDIHSGMAANPPVERNVEISLYKINDKKGEAGTKPVLKYEQTVKGQREQFSLKSLDPGIYRMIINDQQKMFVASFSAPVDYSIVMKADEKILTTSSAGLNIFYFYVPKGIKNFRVSKTVILILESPTGRLLKYDNNKDETFDVSVLPGEEGIWGIGNQAGSFYIEGVPPYLALHPSRMLVPAYLKK